jgi:hypothetical protein
VRLPDQPSEIWWKAHPELAPKPQLAQAAQPQGQEDDGEEDSDDDQAAEGSDSNEAVGTGDAERDLPFEKDRYKYDRGFKTWSHLNTDDILIVARKTIGEEIKAEV